jgi:hypothetical protein
MVARPVYVEDLKFHFPWRWTVAITSTTATTLIVLHLKVNRNNSYTDKFLPLIILIFTLKPVYAKYLHADIVSEVADAPDVDTVEQTGQV